ncbi:HK97 gp10 family phage protein [Vagococcus lutrae]|uniref:HK97 gp10 family phage protein n=1 Tax=Vagococcus lutrae TaxID=81947 RepID=UPI0028924865|nr:HK97 gp10 family phage protein [Vagococcus lutrae]MDT2805243.1 HK97 gp10 family phage protein [Vagococcus lutrae]MDT2816285.1 HK97 gp10 family phage protein [Vagococcus lutrae]
MSVKIVGLNAFIKNVNNKPKQIQQAVGKEVNRSALRVERKAKQLAAWDTGWMANNIYASMIKVGKAEVVSPVEYSLYVEKGTRYQISQPFMFPALKADYPLLMKNLNKLMKG